MIWINNNLPILQIILPLFGALLSALSFNKKLASFIAITVITSCLMISTHIFCNINEVRYALGNWSAPIGIEYRLDFLNSPLFIFINGSLLFLLIFCRNLIENTILQYITSERQHLFFSIILFTHMGFLGMLSTNDLFNFYVFIEISSLGSYVLMAQGGNNYAVRGAFDYLMVGSIGATLILIGIGFLLNLTGSLNIDDIRLRLTEIHNTKIIATAICFILIGIFLKMAFFPMHFWMVRAYSSASCAILIYLASISGIIGAYNYLRFIHFVLDYDTVKNGLENILRPLALITILSCGYFALKAPKFKKIIIYSTASQTGYIILLFSFGNNNPLIFQFLVLDLINKISLFLICAKYDEKSLQTGNFEYSFIAITLICSAGLPLSGMFLAKINILGLLLAENYSTESIIIIVGSAIAMLYHYKMAQVLFSSQKYKDQNNLNLNLEAVGIICLMLLQFYMLSSQNQINKYQIWRPDLFLGTDRANIK